MEPGACERLDGWNYGDADLRGGVRRAPAERSSEYAAQAEWLKTPTAFEGEVVFLKLEGGAEFSNKTFQFPKSP